MGGWGRVIWRRAVNSRVPLFAGESFGVSICFQKLRKDPGLNPIGEYMSMNRKARVAREYISAHLQKGELRAGRYEVERGIIIDVTKIDDD